MKDAELKLAQQLIEQQASDTFDPSAYTDEVRARIEAVVQKKVEGQEITMAEAPEGGAQVIDLMEALRASLEKKGARQGTRAAGPSSACYPSCYAQTAQARASGAACSAQGDQEIAPASNRAGLMHQYGVRDVEKLLRLPRSTIRALIAAGFVSPARGPRKTWLFSFQDLIVLRTAQALAAAKVPRQADHPVGRRSCAAISPIPCRCPG